MKQHRERFFYRICKGFVKKNLKQSLGIFAMLLLSLPALSQQEYTHFPWTYGRTLSAGMGVEGTAFTFLGRMDPDYGAYYSELSVPLNPVRSAVGAYYHQQKGQNSDRTDWGLAYNFFIPFSEKTNLRFGVQQNWHKLQATQNAWGQPLEKGKQSSTDFSAMLRRNNLLLGASMENALGEKSQRHYNLLVGVRELQTYSWLRSSSFFLMQTGEGRQAPEFRFNYTGTVLNTVFAGASLYKNSFYSWSANAGIKLFRSIWLSAGADFSEFNTQPDVVEFGLRLNFGKGRLGTASEEADSSPPRSRK